ncbi:SusD/RagB family nutrient-binding outer membrane lipoprotein [Chitinophaga polysaccharea]|uniref:SusD/RagB family nutrient-binding outer membrane lipoprotein n=1 Tax=Chitinophaga TaxID=79328 RepID=UPI0014558756|nr:MULTISPECIES: SusD/RagB family nutrient-binding outer membrane lipoprotein [Chitinophaga]NLR59736.1 SusD/RagB family nutrient-binding outer membrane lipoprotein [Chitinophaga polysaccharea]NLU94089.1 SusD/RagB family nutrient-binding outer membrane lipoprotein [Chitinophaga sp. Ak27]
MKKNSYFLAIIIISITLGACSKELKQVNTNPNALEKPDATTLLSNTIVTEFYSNANIVWTLGNGYNQYMTFSQSYYDQPTRYSPVTNEPYWIPMYEAARDANTLYTLAQAKNNPLLQAAALTLRSYAFAQLTELWGDIPFLQALKGNTGVYTPSYDSQQTVYMDAGQGIIPSLRRADSLLKANPSGLIEGDVLYSSNTGSWRSFINALRLRYLLRVAGKASVAAEMQSIVNDAALMQSSSQSGTLALPTVTPYNFVSLTERSGDFAVKYMNSTLYNQLQATQDTARITAYFTTNATAPAGTPFNFNNYGGMPMVVDATEAQSKQASNFNPSFTKGTNPALIKARLITYAEQEFILAEAALKGYINGGNAIALAHYNNGVIGAFAEIGINAATATSYLAHTGVPLDNSSQSSAMQQIITQKWLANINNGFEGWIEFRRTGYPAFQTGDAANMNNGMIPTRFLYPTSEQTINSKNYAAEVQQMGGKEITTYKAWWEK